jgi:hypothetical protein
MKTEEDARKDGWMRNDDNTLSNKTRQEKLATLTGDTGQLYVKEVGGSYNGYEKYDPDKHGSK